MKIWAIIDCDRDVASLHMTEALAKKELKRLERRYGDIHIDIKPMYVLEEAGQHDREGNLIK